MPDRFTPTWTISIDRPQQQVFDYITDVARHGEWSPKPYRVEGAPSAPVTSGTTFVSYGWIPGDKEHRNDCQVTAVDAPNSLVIRSKEKDAEFVNTFRLSTNNGATVVEREIDMPKPPGVVGVLFPVLLATVIRPGVQKGMKMLKTNLEQAT